MPISNVADHRPSLAAVPSLRIAAPPAGHWTQLITSTGKSVVQGNPLVLKMVFWHQTPAGHPRAVKHFLRLFGPSLMIIDFTSGWQVQKSAIAAQILG
jgi:hypothetical protein